MKHQFWHNLWQNNQLGFHQTSTNPLLQKYWPQMPADGAILVPLCGKSQDMIWLAQHKRPVIGIELSEIAVQAFFAENNLTPHIQAIAGLMRYHAPPITIWQGDFFQTTPDLIGYPTAVYDRAALVALPPAMRQQYAQHLTTLLPPHAQQLLITNDYPQQQMSGPPFSITATEIDTLYGRHFTITQLRRKEISHKVRFPVTSFVQLVHLLQKK